MDVMIILLMLFFPVCVTLIISFIQKNIIRTSKTMSDENFTIMFPNIVSIIGIMCVITCFVLMLCFTFFLSERPHWIFYICMYGGIWLGMYLIIKTLTSKVIVKGEFITVYSAFRKPYSFAYDDIVSAVRQVNKDQLKSERIVIKTSKGKKLIVESSQISYKRFSKIIQLRVKEKYLFGFDK